MKDPLKPPASTLCKVGSIVAHVDELLSPSGHAFDQMAILPLLIDAEVREWLVAMRAMALIPEPR